MAPPRRPLVAGNFKLNLNGAAAEALARGILAALPPEALADSPPRPVDVVLAPGFTALERVGAVLAPGPLGLAAQTLFFADEGAYTGEVGGGQLRAAGCTYVLVGHSERRSLFGETLEGVRLRVAAARRHGLRPILCVGESAAERQAGQTHAVLAEQLTDALGPAPPPAGEVVVAYEPVWAIGSGQSATPALAQEAMAALRQRAREAYGATWAEGVRFLYGGSAGPQNAASLLAEADVDGLLLGGACLRADTFVPVVRAALASGSG